VKFSYISDLHMDFFVREKNPQNPKMGKQIEKFIDNILLNSKKDDIGEALIIAGDIGHYNAQIEELLKQLKGEFDEIFIVHGNHDMYLVSDNISKQYEWDSIQRTIELKNICNGIDRVHYMDGDIVEFDDILIGGLAGWYDVSFPGGIAFWEQLLNDSNLIHDGYPITGAYHYGARGRSNFNPIKYYKTQLEKLKEI